MIGVIAKARCGSLRPKGASLQFSSFCSPRSTGRYLLGWPPPIPLTSFCKHGSITQQLIIWILRLSETWIHVLPSPVSGCLTMTDLQSINFLIGEMELLPTLWIFVRFKWDDVCKCLRTVTGSGSDQSTVAFHRARPSPKHKFAPAQCPSWAPTRRQGHGQAVEFCPHMLFGFSLRKSTSFSAAPKCRGERGAECHLSVHCWWKVVSAWQTLAPGKDGRGLLLIPAHPLGREESVCCDKGLGGEAEGVFFMYLCSLDDTLHPWSC